MVGQDGLHLIREPAAFSEFPPEWQSCRCCATGTAVFTGVENTFSVISATKTWLEAAVRLAEQAPKVLDTAILFLLCMDASANTFAAFPAADRMGLDAALNLGEVIRMNHAPAACTGERLESQHALAAKECNHILVGDPNLLLPRAWTGEIRPAGRQEQRQKRVERYAQDSEGQNDVLPFS